jgi:hypothetical protein
VCAEKIVKNKIKAHTSVVGNEQYVKYLDVSKTEEILQPNDAVNSVCIK